jgi:hypothetical protein
MYLSFDIGEINMAYCLLKDNKRIHRWGLFSIRAPTYEGKCKAMCLELDKLCLEGTDEPLTILIEQQPKINAKMRVIEGFLFMYFVRKKMEGSNINKIISYSPKHKLKCYKGEPIILKCKEGYYKRKKLSIEHCTRLIVEDDPEWKKLFEGSKKKDDLSDCYLQGLSYINYDLATMVTEEAPKKTAAKKTAAKKNG